MHNRFGEALLVALMAGGIGYVAGARPRSPRRIVDILHDNNGDSVHVLERSSFYTTVRGAASGVYTLHIYQSNPFGDLVPGHPHSGDTVLVESAVLDCEQRRLARLAYVPANANGFVTPDSLFRTATSGDSLYAGLARRYCYY